MSLQRTPPKCASNPDLTATSISAAVEDVFINTRKRKQPDHDDVDQRLKSMEKQFENIFITLPHKIDNLISAAITTSLKSMFTSEFSKISTSLDNLNDTVMGLRRDNDCFKKSLTDITNRLTEMEQSLNMADSRQDLFENQLKTLTTQMQQTCDLPQYIQRIESKLAAIEQQARECNLEIVNLPDRRNENLISIVTGIGSALKQQIQPSDIVSCHRVPHADQKDTRPKNVIVKFTTRILRDNIIAASRSTRSLNTEQLAISGPSQKVYINEHLTLKNKILFRECRSKAKAHNYKFIWIKHGVILIRKSDTTPVLAVRSEQDLDKIK
jgi:hypothetical protein